MAKSWFSMKARAGGDSASIDIYSDIGEWGITADEFRRSLDALGRPRELHLAISSNGGDVSAGFAIYNLLARHPAKKIVTVSGIAASMASVIAMAGDEVRMPSNSLLMIHNPWGSFVGESEQMISFGEALGKMRDQIADAYVNRSGMNRKEVIQMMDRETWLNAQEAVELGFADKVIDAVKMAALIDTGKFKNTPASYRASCDNWRPTSFDDIRVKAFRKWNSAGSVS